MANKQHLFQQQLGISSVLFSQKEVTELRTMASLIVMMLVPVSQLKEQRMVDLGEESLENLEEVFQRIHTMKGEDNLDILVTRFIQGES